MALFAASGFLAQGRSVKPLAPIIWAATAAAAPLAILIALYYRIYVFDRSLPFAALALLIAALFAVATELITKREPRPGSASAAAIFATGSIAALALALTFALEKGWLTVALALMVPGTAWIAEKRPLPWLRWLCGILVALVMVRIAWEPRIVTDVGTTPIFNWILYGYGIPALAFWVAGFILRKRADDTPTRMVEAGAILFTVLTAFLQIRHFIYSGDIYYPSADLTELALQVCGGLALAIGLERLRERTQLGRARRRRADHHRAHADRNRARAGRAVENPLLTGTSVGGPFFNLILLGYGLPAILMAALGLTVRGNAPADLQHHLRRRGGRARARLSLAHGDTALSRAGAGPRRVHRRRRLHLLGGVARLRRGAALRRHLPALAAGAALLGRRGAAHRRQGVPHRHGGPHRRVARASPSSASAWCWSGSATSISGSCSGSRRRQCPLRSPHEAACGIQRGSWISRSSCSGAPEGAIRCSIGLRFKPQAMRPGSRDTDDTQITIRSHSRQ